MSGSDFTVDPATSHDVEACPLCGAYNVAQWTNHVWAMPGSTASYTYRQCQSCEAISCHPIPSAHELARFYQQHFSYEWYEKVRWLKAIQSAHRWQRIKQYLNSYPLSSRRLLDVGCGHGWLLKQAQRAGWKVTGIDYPSIATRYAKDKLGLQIFEGEVQTVIDEKLVSREGFDLITVWHCLEHHPRPLALLDGLSDLLAPGGKLLLAVPNAESIGMRQRREAWIWCQLPYVHIYHFTRTALAAVVQQSGLQVLGTWTRDTWDAQPADARDGGLWKSGRYIDQVLSKYLNKVSGRLAHWAHNCAFWTQECVRVGSYVLSCRQHWMDGLERTDGLGSELLLLAQKNHGALYKI